MSIGLAGSRGKKIVCSFCHSEVGKVLFLTGMYVELQVPLLHCQ